MRYLFGLFFVLICGCQGRPEGVLTSLEPSNVKHVTLTFRQEVSGVEESFKFKNTGAGPLKILSVEPSGGTIWLEETPKMLLPGEEGSIKFTMQARTFSEQSAQIAIKTDSSITPRLDFTLVLIVDENHLPMIFKMDNSLTFSSDEEYRKGLNFTISTLQNLKDNTAPQPQISHPDAVIQPIGTLDRPRPEEGIVQRDHQYRLSFKQVPRELNATFIDLPHPWDPKKPAISIPVQAKKAVNPSLDIAPARVIWGRDQTEARILVRARPTDKTIKIQTQGEAFPFVIEETPQKEDEFQVFLIKKRANAKWEPKIHQFDFVVEGSEPLLKKTVLIRASQ